MMFSIVINRLNFQMPYLKLSQIVYNVAHVMLSVKGVNVCVNVTDTLNMIQQTLIMMTYQFLVMEI
jgi:hypothetical protein